MPLRTKIVLRIPKLQPNFKKDVDKAATSVMYQSARDWISAVVKKVPIWSGFALGSVKYARGRSGPSSGLFLGQYLKVAIPITPTHPRKDKTPLGGGLHGRYTFSQSGNQYRFTYQSDIIYYAIQDFFGPGTPGVVSPTAPWESLIAGDVTFRRALNRNMKKALKKIKIFTVSDPSAHTTAFEE